MPAKLKPGLEYFSVDVDLFSNYEVRVLIKEFGMEAVSMLIKLKIDIYKYEGYFFVCNGKSIFSLAESLNTEEETIWKFIRKCVELEIFDAFKFEQFNILTSKEIQQNYLFATKRRKANDIISDYLIDDTTVREDKKDTIPLCKQNVCKGRQRIRKDKIRKESKGEGGGKKNEEDEGNEEMKKNIPSLPSLQPPPPPPSWKNDYKIYIQDLAQAYNDIICDKHYMECKQRLYPEMDIKKTLEKIITEYWGTSQGWNQKKKHPDDIINWKLTFDKQMNYPYNVIRKT